MTPPVTPADEASRLESLRSLNILDSVNEERFDRLTRLAQQLFRVPIVAISLVDETRQWFKSAEGLPVKETARDISFCGHAILGEDLFEVDDASNDVRFSDNPLVTGDPQIRFYAGCPLSVSGGARVGTLCIIDRKPRRLDASEREALRDLARLVESEFSALQLATTDELTGLCNRRGFQMLGQRALDTCNRMGLEAALLYIDLDGFKAINDTHGHAEGDRALRQYAAILCRALRGTDVIGRMGGDEFAALLLGCSAPESQQVAERIAQGVATHNATEGARYSLRYSLGTVGYEAGKHTSMQALLDEADAAMYRHKRARSSP